MYNKSRKWNYSSAMQKTNRPMVRSIDRVSAILKALGESAEMLTDISERVDLSKSTTHRLLNTLKASGFVSQDAVTKHYYLGHVMTHLASRTDVLHRKLIAYSFDEMRYLRDLTGETVAIWIKVGTQRMLLEELPSNQTIRLTMGKGFVAPLYCGAGGKVLLSQLPDSERQMILNAIKLVKITENTIIDKEALLNKVREAEEKGYATAIGELMKGNAGIAVPIKNYECPASLGIFGPEVRFKKHMMNFLRELKECAERISENLLSDETRRLNKIT